ncbi:hypothetical protein F2Q68_00004787 [Brassica cretica]|uniref:Uncharacterized protein n=1 Tax=Brassica cretica TaxID=69181 RepID=A0A8S9JCT5_BRACR|nr:hypothetical protein F2Q68_00004787 [Brassica cretica]
MYAKRLRTKLIIKNSSDYEGKRTGSSRQRPPILANPCQKLACPQKIKMGMRHKAGMGMRKPEEHMVYLLQKYCEIHGAIKTLLLQTWKAAKPGTWVITATPAPSKPDLRENPRFSHDLRVQSRSQEPPGSNYGLRTNQRIFGFPYRLQASFMIPGSRGEPPGSPTTSGSQIITHGLGEPPGPRHDLRI